MRKINFAYHIIIGILSVVGILLIFFSCKKEDSEIGSNLLRGQDKIKYFCDTIDVNCYTLSPEKIEINNKTISPLGSYVDPIFGFTKASAIFQTNLSSSNVDFSNVKKVNSLELHLKINSCYGDSISSQTIYINRLLKDIYDTVTYYSDFRLEPGEYSLLETSTISYNQADTSKILKYKLPDELAYSFINSTNKDHFSDDEAFKKFFKGFYLTTENVSSGGGLYSLAITDGKSQMILNYNDSLSFTFPIDSKSAILKSFEHDYSSASQDLISVMDDTTAINDYCYVQGLAGVRTIISFPDLENILDTKNISVNRARLLVNLADNHGEDKYPPTTRLALLKKDSSGELVLITDGFINENVDGYYDDYKYALNISLHIQEIVSGISGNEQLYLTPLYRRDQPHRAVLFANPEKENGMKLELSYSKY